MWSPDLKGLLLCLVVLAFSAGCGYHVAGRGGDLPGGVTSVTVPFFDNRTKKPDIESTVTTAFINELVTTVDVVKDGEAVLNGVITSYNLRPVSFTQRDISQEYRLTVGLSVELVRASDGEVLWLDHKISNYEDFTVDLADVVATEEAELEALRKIARDVARYTKERMIEGF